MGRGPSPRRSRPSVSLVVALASALVGCSEDALTQLVVVVDSDLPGDAIDELTIDVRAPTGTHYTASLPVDATRPLPASVSLVHRGGPLGPLEIVVDARRASATVVTRLVRTSFVRGETRAWTVRLLGACAGRACDAGSTCGERGCTSPDVEPASLDRWTGRLPPPLSPEPVALDAEVDGAPIDGSTREDVRDLGALGDAGDLGPADAGHDAGDAAPACVPRHPPERPASSDPSGSQRFFAIERFDIGTGTGDAWRAIGLDLDDRCTTSESEPDALECRTRVGAGHPDGDEGIDNQFGAAIIPAITAFDPLLFEDFNTSFLRGTYGLVLSVSGWNLSSNDDAVVVALLEATSGYGPAGPPEHIGADRWVIGTDSLIGGDLERPLCSGSGYVADGVVVAQLPSRCGFRIVSADGNLVDVRLSRPTVMATIEGRAPGFGDGLLVGRWRVSDFVDVFRYVSDVYCPDMLGPTLEMALRTASDVRAEGDADPSAECDAVSFGARFRAGPAFVEPTVGPSFTETDYCPGM